MARVCPVCQTAHHTWSSFSRDEWTLRECDRTGLIYLENPPSYDALESEFAFEVTFAKERERRRHAEPLWSRLSDGVKTVRRTLFPKRNKIARLTRTAWLAQARPSPFRLLDVGCGYGNVLEDVCAQLVKQGARVTPHGVEVSRELSRIAGECFGRMGGSVVNLPGVDGVQSFPESHFHCAVLSSYLEHESNPFEVLKAIRARLLPGGQVLIKVPNFASWNRIVRGARWCGFRFPDHVNYFTPQALKEMVSEAGYQGLRMKARDRFPLSDNMYLVATRA